MKITPRLLTAGILIGILLTLAPLFGLLGTIFGVERAFETLGTSGHNNLASLSHSIGMAQIPTVAGLLLCPFGIVILALSIYHCFRTPPASPTTLVPPEMP